MKYFTFELWMRMQDQKDSLEADEEWATAATQYFSELEAMRDLMDKTTYKLLTSGVLHDGLVTSISSPDDRELAILVKNWQGRIKLTFKGVTNFNFNYARSQGQLGPRTMFEWGYDELTTAENGLLAFGVLFTSGIELDISCKKIKISEVK